MWAFSLFEERYWRHWWLSNVFLSSLSALKQPAESEVMGVDPSACKTPLEIFFFFHCPQQSISLFFSIQRLLGFLRSLHVGEKNDWTMPKKTLQAWWHSYLIVVICTNKGNFMISKMITTGKKKKKEADSTFYGPHAYFRISIRLWK